MSATPDVNQTRRQATLLVLRNHYASDWRNMVELKFFAGDDGVAVYLGIHVVADGLHQAVGLVITELT